MINSKKEKEIPDIEIILKAGVNEKELHCYSAGTEPQHRCNMGLIYKSKHDKVGRYLLISSG